MLSYIIKRLILIVPTFLGMTVVLFFITRIMPGGPIEMAIMQQQAMGEGEGGGGMSGGGGGPGSESRGSLSEEQMQQLKEFYGFDKPWHVAYWEWLNKLIRLDFGYSTRYSTPVLDMLKERLGVSAYYGILTFLITYLVCIPLGIAKAFKHGSFLDVSTSIFTFIGFAIPSYVVAIVLMVVFGANLEWFPMGGFVSDEAYDLPPTSLKRILDVIYHSILPMISYLIGSFAMLTFYMKSYLMEQMSEDYVRTAVAKGVPYKQAVIKHAFRNSIIPLAGGFGALLTVFITTNFLVEKIFNIDGLGLLGFESLLARDYPVIMGTFAIASFLSLLGAIVSDFAVAVIDPRVSYD